MLLLIMEGDECCVLIFIPIVAFSLGLPSLLSFRVTCRFAGKAYTNERLNSIEDSLPQSRIWVIFCCLIGLQDKKR
jgi:hypothetical protein